MKRTDTLYTVLVILLITFSSAIYAEYVPPVRSMEIPYASQNMIIDGVADESCWSSFQSTEVFNKTGGTGADADFSFTFKVCYDENYL